MIIPNKIMDSFIKETENLNYGKVSLCLIRRGKHEHYEIDKHFTMTKDGDLIAFNQENTTKND